MALPPCTPCPGQAPLICCSGSSNNFVNSRPTSISTPTSCTMRRLITSFLRRGKSIVIDGHSLSIPALVAAARHNAPIMLNGSHEIRTRIQKSRDIIMEKVETSQSVYGVSTGFGGSGTASSQASVLVCHSTSSVFKPILAQRIPWLLEVHYYNTSMRVSCHRPRMSCPPSLSLIPSLLLACQSLGFVERSSSVSIL
jgi:hypothetical protein